MPGNAAAGGEAAIGSGRLLNQTAAEFELPNTSHAVSADGSTIFWSSGQTGHVYARIDGERTLEVPGPASCKASEPLAARACFLTATPDGSKALLANGAIYGLNGAGSAYEEVADLTGGEGGFKGILGASEDLSRVYFVDTKDLGGDRGGRQGEANLYAWHEGTTQLRRDAAGRRRLLRHRRALRRLAGLALGPHRAGERRRALPGLHVAGALDGL